VGFGLMIAIWWAEAARLGPARLPTPWAVAQSFFPLLWSSPVLAAQSGPDGIVPALAYTTSKVLLGVTLGASCGIILGLLMGASRSIDDLLTKVVEIVRAIPPLAAVPFFLLWFGTSDFGRTLLVIVYTALMVLISTRAAVRYTDPIFDSWARTFGAGRTKRFVTILLPAIIPRIASGVRVALAFSWGLEVVAELLGAQEGVGRVFVILQNSLAVKEIMITVIWISLIAYGVDRMYLLLTSRLTRWAPRLS
jgi:ABC-type nitrate/sulfonate/bicarbonate transport system permease component